MVNTSLLILGGNPPSEDLLFYRVEDADHKIAADGGLIAFLNAGECPDVLVGDFDSVHDINELDKKYPSLQVVRKDEQETTDFQKALVWITENTQSSRIVILGALGKRTDHLITNILIASNVDECIEITIDDDMEWMRRVTPSCPLSLKGRSGDLLSILAIKECFGVNTNGLKWDLTEARIGPERIIGQSNQCRSDVVEIKCKEGAFWVFLEKIRI